MPNFWRGPLIALFIFLITALVVWPIAGSSAALLFLVGALIAYLYYHLSNLKKLRAWLVRPDPAHVPQGIGLWEDCFSALYHLVRRQSRDQYKLASTLERFRRAAAAFPDGVVVLNEEGQIEWCNPIAEQHFGLNVTHDRGQRISYLLRQAQFSEYLTAQNYSEPLLLNAKRNQKMLLSIQLIPFGDNQKLLISRDVSHLQRVETMRKDFVANVSHELGTPLTIIGGFLETLAEMELSDDKTIRHYFKLMSDETMRMQRLVEDLLLLSRLESAYISLDEQPVNVVELMKTMINEAQALSAGRHEFKLEVESTAQLLANERELYSAFSNLLSNAIRYTPQGLITLRWEVKAGEGIFSVADTGIGIEAEHIPRLTERFYRVDRGRSRETGGTGLGLSIVKHILTRHQGSLDISSVPGEGSIFKACFPPRRIMYAS